MGIKGQKINPVGWRLGFYRKWKSLWFQESWNYGIVLNKMFKIQEIIESFLLYKRFSALACNVQIINQSSEKFIILVFFYNLRNKNINSGINQNISKNRIKISQILFSWEKKILIKNFELKNTIYNTNKKFDKLFILNYLKKTNKKKFSKIINSTNYTFVENFKDNKEKFKDIHFNQKKTMKNWFFNQISKNTRKKGNIIKILNNNKYYLNDYKNKSLNQLFWFKNLLQNKNILNFYILWNYLKKEYIYLNNFNHNFPILEFFSIYNFKNIPSNIKLSFLLLILEKNAMLSKYIAYQNMLYVNYFFKFFKISNNFSLILEKNFLNLFNILYNKYDINLIKGKLISTNLKENTLKNKEKSLILNSIKNININLIKNYSQSNIKTLGNNLKTINKKDFYLTRKLISIRETAVSRKLDRLKYNSNIKTKWKYLSHFIMRFYNKFKFNKNYHKKSKNEHMVRKYLELMSKHIYYTLPKIKNMKAISSKDLGLNIQESSSKQVFNQHLNDINYFYQKLIEKNSVITKFKWHFSLEDLLNSLKIILKSDINLFFINSLTFLKYQTRFIDLEENDNVKKLGAKLLWQKIRLQKINASTQIKWLSKQPSLIERRGKRKGPFLQDFVFLALIALTTRQFKPLLRFINFQTKNIGKTKRQIPFLRFLMRILSNLAGGLIKIKGMRIQFKGRFDRWNRTKSLIFTTGNIPLQRKDIDVEYSSSKGMVKKGTYGIRFWVWYGNNYHSKYSKFFKTFWYSNISE